MKLAALFSGGKDSVMAIDWLEKRGHDVECLITMISESDESYMFHIPNVQWTKLQAEAMRIPIIQKKTKGEKEKELEDLKAAIVEAKEKYGIEGVSAGAIASEYQRGRVIKICNDLGLVPFTPYWNWNDDRYMQEVLSSGYEIILVGVFADGLDKSFLAKRLDAVFYERLRETKKKTGIHLAGEGGEYETFVLSGPKFSQSLLIKNFKIEETNNSAVMQITDIELVGEGKKNYC